MDTERPPSGFAVRSGQLRAGEIPLGRLAEEFGTPLYVYEAQFLRRRFRGLVEALGPRLRGVRYSVKACSNLAILRLLGDCGAGFDVVSRGELARCLAIGAAPENIVFAGAGKTREELLEALDRRAGTIHGESAEELEFLAAEVTRRRQPAGIALRINPGVDAHTHPYISTGLGVHKFGVSAATARELLPRIRATPLLEFRGFHVHVGSQVLSIEPYLEALERLEPLVHEARALGLPCETVDLGGGFGTLAGVPAPEEGAGPPAGHGGARELDLAALGAALTPRLAALDLDYLVEPGRFLVAGAGVLLARILSVKRSAGRCLVITDTGMNDFLRPALYRAEHPVVPVEEKQGAPVQRADVLGPVCESGDFLALDVPLPDPQPGDLLAVLHAGAYGFSMASTYNSRPRPAEILVDGPTIRCIRPRETVEDLFRPERERGPEPR